MRRAFVIILATLLAGFAVLYYLFTQDISKARALVAGRSQRIDTTFGKIEYAEAGKGEAVLSIHGSGGGFDQGLDMTSRLADGYRVISPSRFGYLGSDYPPDLTVAMQADAFAELLNTLDVKEAFIFGGSAGALSATEFAIRYPHRCRALVLLVPAAYAPTRKPNTSGTESPMAQMLVNAMLGSDFIFWVGTRFFPDTMTKTILATDPALVHAADAKEQARVRATLAHILPITPRARGLLFDGHTAGAPEPQALEEITCPVLTVSTRDDLYGTSDPAEYIAGRVRNGRAIVYPTGGHLWVGHEDDVWQEIRAFLIAVDGNSRRKSTSLGGVGCHCMRVASPG
jgi:pimeloyl-ACP methyl ester carboxylesterase